MQGPRAILPHLPDELHLWIFEYLGPFDLVRLSQTTIRNRYLAFDVLRRRVVSLNRPYQFYKSNGEVIISLNGSFEFLHSSAILRVIEVVNVDVLQLTLYARGPRTGRASLARAFLQKISTVQTVEIVVKGTGKRISSCFFKEFRGCLQLLRHKGWQLVTIRWGQSSSAYVSARSAFLHFQSRIPTQFLRQFSSINLSHLAVVHVKVDACKSASGDIAQLAAFFSWLASLEHLTFLVSNEARNPSAMLHAPSHYWATSDPYWNLRQLSGTPLLLSHILSHPRYGPFPELEYIECFFSQPLQCPLHGLRDSRLSRPVRLAVFFEGNQALHAYTLSAPCHALIRVWELVLDFRSGDGDIWAQDIMVCLALPLHLVYC